MVTATARVRPQAHPAESRISVAVIDNEAGFDTLRDDWDAIVDRMDPSSPMLSWEWSRTWWRHFGHGQRLQILTFVEDGHVIGIAQFQERRLGVGRLALRVLKPIGWEDYGNQGLTEQLELLFPPERRAELMAELARWLQANRITSVWLPAVDVAETLPPWIAERVIEKQPHVPFHHRELPSDWLAFVQGLNKSMRSNSRYYAKLLIRHGHSFELDVAESPAEVTKALPAVIALHKTRAQAAEVSRVQHWDHFYRGDRATFIREVGPRLAERGEFKVGRLILDGEVVAGQMWFEKSRTIFLYYSGFVPEWAKYGVQLVTTLEVLKNGMSRGMNRVEFLRGGGQVKERWDTDVRVVRNTQVAPSRVLATGVRVAATARLRLRSRG